MDARAELPALKFGRSAHVPAVSITPGGGSVSAACGVKVSGGMTGLPSYRQATISALYLSECCVCVPSELPRLRGGGRAPIRAEETASAEHQATGRATEADPEGVIACEASVSSAFAAATSAISPNRNLAGAASNLMRRSYPSSNVSAAGAAAVKACGPNVCRSNERAKRIVKSDDAANRYRPAACWQGETGVTPCRFNKREGGYRFRP